MAVGFAGLNALAYGHARTMTHFTAGGTRTGKAETLSWSQKLWVLAIGVQLPKPSNSQTPLDRQSVVHGFISRLGGSGHESKGASE